MLKRHVIILILVVALSALTGLNSCAQMDDVSDQAPVLMVDIKIAPGSEATIIPSKTNQIYLMYYLDNNWLAPYLQQGTTGFGLINPSVGTFSTFVAAFWDQNGNTMLDAGEPCTGYVNANHSAAQTMTEINFLPLEWKKITITLDVGITY